MKDEIWRTMSQFANHLGIRPERQWPMATAAKVLIIKGIKKGSTGPVQGYATEEDYWLTAAQAGWRKRSVDGKVQAVKDSGVRDLP